MPVLFSLGGAGALVAAVYRSIDELQADLDLWIREYHLLAECDALEFVQHGLAEALADAVGLCGLLVLVRE